MVYTVRTNAIDLGLLGKIDIEQMAASFEMLTNQRTDSGAH